MKRLGTAKFLAIFVPSLVLTGWAFDYFKGRPLRGLIDFAPEFIGVIIGVAIATFISRGAEPSKDEVQ